MIQWFDIIGYIASIFIACFSMPQLYNIFKYKDTSNVNVLMFSLMVTGCFLFFIYGMGLAIDVSFITAIPILLTNSISGISSSIILILKVINTIGSKKLKITEKEFCQKKANKKGVKND